MTKPGPRILVVDIETSPNLAYVWGMFKQNVGLNQLADRGQMICFAAKWCGEKTVEYRSDFHDGHADMVARAWTLLDEADAVVGYNSARFDVPLLNREFLLAGLTPPSPHKDIDLLRTVRGRFRFVSNKLDNALTELDLPRKLDTGGFELWRDCMAGDAKAWASMKRYNVQDVRSTEALYERLVPWITNHPHYGLYVDSPDEAGQHVCQRCGSTELQRRGHAYTALGKYPRFMCKKCGSFSRGKRAVATVGARGVA